MGKRGPASTFQPEYIDLARRHCMLGCTNDDLAKLFDVCSTTLVNWMNQVSDFRQAIVDGRGMADAEIAESLYKRARGYERPATRVMQTPDGPQTVEYIHHHAPDTQASIFWLRNRRADLWRERVEHEHHVSGDIAALLEAAGERLANAKRP